MIRTIYIAAKPGDPRLYPAMNGFTPEAADELVRKGFMILEVPILMPYEFGIATDAAVAVVNAKRIR